MRNTGTKARRHEGLVLGLLAGIWLLAGGGCAAQQQRQACFQAIVADDSAVKATTALVPGQVDVATATKIYQGAVTARAALASWAAAIAAGDQNAVATASNAANAALGTLAQQLAAAQSGSATLKRRMGKARLTAVPAKLTPGEVVAVIQLAADLSPILTNWIDAAFNTPSVTDAQIATELAALDADLAALGQAVDAIAERRETKDERRKN